MASIVETMSGVQDSVSSFDPSGISNFFTGFLVNKFVIFGKFLFYVAVAVLGGITIWKFMFEYNIIVTVKSMLGGGGTEIKRDRAKIVVDEQGKRKLQLYKLKEGKKRITTPLPESFFKSKMGKRDHYEFWLDDNYQLQPIPVAPIIDEAGNKVMKLMPVERNAWARYEDKAIREKIMKKEMFEKYMPSVIMISAMVFAFLIFFFGFGSLKDGMGALASQFAQVAASCTSLR